MYVKYGSSIMINKDLSIVVDAYQSEVEAYGMYTKMIKQAKNKELIKVLRHNRKEEKEHMKLLERVYNKLYGQTY